MTMSQKPQSTRAHVDNESRKIDTIDDIYEAAWLHVAAHNPAFASLEDASEDIYSIADGKPFHPEA